jgi:hypothetical protein
MYLSISRQHNCSPVKLFKYAAKLFNLSELFDRPSNKLPDLMKYDEHLKRVTQLANLRINRMQTVITLSLFQKVGE